MLHIENRRYSRSWKFADIQLEHPRLERPFSYYEKRALKNQLHERLRLISQGSIFHGNLLMVQVITFWIENNSRPLIVYKIFAELSKNACSEFGWQVWREISALISISPLILLSTQASKQQASSKQAKWKLENKWTYCAISPLIPQ